MIVWRGRVGSQLSIQEGVGLKPEVGDARDTAWADRLVELFGREKEGWPAGILPRAFSDMPRIWEGSWPSAEEMEGLREV